MSNPPPEIDPEAQALLDFWFAADRKPRWFVSDADFDAELARRFGAPREAAADGRLDHWAETPRGALALVLLLDQLPRNLFRGDPRAFATDPKALAVAEAAIARGFDRSLDEAERLFLYLPFEHSEALDHQHRAVALIEDLRSDPEWLRYAVLHLKVIERFGRFPHRNAALGRASTPEEEAFLKEPGSSF